MPRLSHVTSADAAASVLETGAIHGASWHTEASGEAYPHFNHTSYADGGNYVACPEVKLFFQCTLPEVRGGGVSAGYVERFEPGVLHCQFFDWDPSQPDQARRFWQAIIHPETQDPLAFDGYEPIGGTKLSARTRKLLDRHAQVGTSIRVVWHPRSPMAYAANQVPLRRPSFWTRLRLEHV